MENALDKYIAHLDSIHCCKRCRQSRLRFNLSPLLSPLHLFGIIRSNNPLFAMTLPVKYNPTQGWGSTQKLRLYPLGVVFYSPKHRTPVRRDLEFTFIILQWGLNVYDSASNHQPHNSLINRLFECRLKKTSKLLVTGLCAGNSPGTGEFPAQMASNAENVSIWWRHHAQDDVRRCCIAIFVALLYIYLPLNQAIPGLTKSLRYSW